VALTGPFIAQQHPAETIASLQAFRKRHAEAQRLQQQYANEPTTVDIARYRSVLRNQSIVDEAEKLLNGFKPVTYDVDAHVKAIEAFEAKAVRPERLSAR
jgi:F-type H+-transporting ATPase subunit d